jgi:hypothetical protein
VVPSPLAGYDTDLVTCSESQRSDEGGDALLAAQSGDDHHPRRALLAFPRHAGAGLTRWSCSTRPTSISATTPIADGIRLLERYPRLIVLHLLEDREVPGSGGLCGGRHRDDRRFNRVRAPTA